MNEKTGIQTEEEPRSNKTLLISIHMNFPPFLEAQLRLCRNNVALSYDFVVGWDEPQSLAKSLGLENSSNQARSIANSYGASFQVIPPWIHNERNLFFSKSDLVRHNPIDPAVRCANTLNYMLGMIPWRKYKDVLVLDSDMFPIKQISESPVGSTKPIAGVSQVRGKSHYEYFWNGLVWISAEAPFSELINFDIVKTGKVKTDVGGRTNQYIQLCRRLNLDPVFLNHFSSLTWGLAELESLQLGENLENWIQSDYRNTSGFYSEIYDGKFLHYRGGGNWMNRGAPAEIENRLTLIEALELDRCFG
jgi:hypothetical protein